MTPRKQLLYLVTVTLCLAIIVKCAQVALTFDIVPILQALVSNLAVQFLLVGVAVLWLLSLCVLAWERAERRHAEWCERLAEAERWETERRKQTSGERAA